MKLTKGQLFRVKVDYLEWAHKGDVYIVDSRNGYRNQLYPLTQEKYRNGSKPISGMNYDPHEFEKL